MVIDKITELNCFEIYMTSQSLPFNNSVSNSALSKFMLKINNFYDENFCGQQIQDPYVAQYSQLHISEIRKMLFINETSTTITRILTFSNWFKRNKSYKIRKEIMSVLAEINEKASYIHRKKIIFMRNIRDEILAGLQSLENVQR